MSKYADALEIPMKQKFRRLSTGSQTKLCLLLALAQGAELLVLDEPTAGLDPVVTDQLLRALVDDFANEGRTLFLSSHHLSEVERIADWVGIIDHGKLLLEAGLDDLRANFRRVRVVGENLPARPLAAKSSKRRPVKARPSTSCAPTRTRSSRSCEARARRCSTLRR